MAEAPVASPGGRSGHYGPLAVATVTMALVTWPIAFNLGAYDAVFYEDVFRFVVAASAGLAVSVIAPPYEGRRLGWVRAALAAPALWLTGAVVLFDSTAVAATDPFYGPVAFVVAVVSVPVVLKMLADLFVSEISLLDDARVTVAALAVVIAVAVAGYLVGANNDAFLTCGDFTVAGSDRPANCASG